MPGDEDDVLAGDAEAGQEALDRGEDGVVTAAGAPAHLLVGLEVLGLELGLLRRPRWSTDAAIASAMGPSAGMPRSMVVIPLLRWGRRPAGRRCVESIDVLQDGGELGGPEGQAAHLRVALDVDQVLARAAAATSWPEVHLRADHPVVAAQDVAEVGRHRVEVAQVDLRHRAARARGPAGRRRRSGRRSSPSRARRRVASPSGSSTSVGGRSAAMPSILACRGAGHEVVVGRVVGDVAGAVGLLQPADAVLQPARAGDRPRPGQGLRVAQVGQELARPSRRRWARSRSRRAVRSGSSSTAGTAHGSEPLAR